MTAEIAICNVNGIALAADSAVSMGNGDKIYNSANKLFSLSKYHPVAIMVYNRGSLLNVPWETIIKQYRDNLGANEYGTLQEYCHSFWSFILTKMPWFPEQDRERFIEEKIRRLLQEIRDDFLSTASNSGTNPDDNKAIALCLIQCITKFHNLVDRIAFADGFGTQDIDEILLSHEEQFIESAENILENAYHLVPEESKRSLIRTCATTLTKAYFDHYSGVVIAGFGKDEIYPKVATYKAGIFANGKHRLQLDSNLSNIHEEVFIPKIFPYAQDDVVRSFIQGVDPEIDKYLTTLLGGIPALADNIDPLILAGNTDDERETSRARLRQTIADFSQNLLDQYKQGIFELGTNELLGMLSVLPKDELAEMAESLVNLTAFKRRMTAAKESVGGPIDVAILSKGDGFIWIKRKHYFKPELNQNFFHNYFNE